MQVQCKFFSKQAEITLPDVPIRVPSDMKRYGLSEIISLILSQSTDAEKKTTRPFDFLINGNLLRSSLQEYLNAQTMSTENTINIEVISSVVPPTDKQSFKQDEWLSSVSKLGDLSLSGCFDGKIRTPQYDLQHGDKAVKCIATANVMSADGTATVPTLISGGLDCQALVWNLDSKQIVGRCEHEGSVETALFLNSSDLFLTGSYDETIKLWSVNDAPLITSSANLNRSKRVKTEFLQKPVRSVFTGHSMAVTSIATCPSAAQSEFYSAGMDNSIRLWNVDSCTAPLRTILTPHFPTCLSVSRLNVVVSGHADRQIRMWDFRASASTASSLNAALFKGHARWVSCISWNPADSFHFVSGSYDGSIRIWDIRSNQPVYTLKGDGSKIFSVKWLDNDEIIYGGESGKFGVLDFNSGAATDMSQ